MTSSNRLKIREHYPSAILEAKVWGCWASDSQGRKIPRGGFTSNSHDNSMSFEDACATADANGWHVAIQLGEMPEGGRSIAGIDLDKCFNEDGSIKPWADEAIEHLDGFHFEVSPSGTGLKGVGVIINDKGLALCASPRMDEEGGVIELHLPHAGASSRYYTVTGNSFDHEFNGDGESTLAVFEEATEWVKESSIDDAVFEAKKPATNRKDKEGKFRNLLYCSIKRTVMVDDVTCLVNCPQNEDEARLQKAKEYLDQIHLPAKGSRNNTLKDCCLPFISNAVGLLGWTKAFQIWDAHIRSDANYTDDFEKDIVLVWNNMSKYVVPTTWDVVSPSECSANHWKFTSDLVGDWNYKSVAGSVCEAFTGETPEEAAQALFDSLAEVDDDDSDAEEDMPEVVRNALDQVKQIGFDAFSRKHYGYNLLESEQTLALDAVDTEVVIKHCFARKMTTGLMGDSKSGKTILACDLAVSLSTGTDFLAHEERVFENLLGTPVKTLLISAETPAWDLKEQIKDIREDRGLDREINPQWLRVCRKIEGWDDNEYFAAMASMIAEFRPEFVIFDPLYFFVDDDSIQRSTFKRQINRITTLFDHYGVTPIYVDHLNKSDAYNKKFRDEDIVPKDSSSMYGNGRDSFFRGWVMVTPRHVRPDFGSGRIRMYLTAGGAWHQRRGMGGEWAIDLQVAWPRMDGLLEIPETPYGVRMCMEFDDYLRDRDSKKEQQGKEDSETYKEVWSHAVLKTLAYPSILAWRQGESYEGVSVTSDHKTHFQNLLNEQAQAAGYFGTLEDKNASNFKEYVAKLITQRPHLKDRIDDIKVGRSHGFKLCLEEVEFWKKAFIEDEISRMLGVATDSPHLVKEWGDEKVGLYEDSALCGEDIRDLVKQNSECVTTLQLRNRYSGFEEITPEMLESLTYWKPIS